MSSVVMSSVDSLFPQIQETFSSASQKTFSSLDNTNPTPPPEKPDYSDQESLSSTLDSICPSKKSDDTFFFYYK